MTDIMTRLKDLLAEPVPTIVERQHVRDIINEIERLQKQNAYLEAVNIQMNQELTERTERTQ